ncbi:unnamed protein product [Coffea canephora]|uniref:RING-type domain-containing protein n=1 Tax=Coffea canephora TaxID=49390 RepID=A0A068UJR4_COFCA|nr:unnamed protein product [Coffea canephora]
MVGSNSTAETAFAKTICSICYEDLKPIVEDLQSISICGHVFHELCLQQWFEYCTNGKKKNCPVCKQTCSNANVGRLYFQSVGDPNDPGLTQKAGNYEENPEELRNEVRRLEGKVLGLSSALEQLQKSSEAVNAELCMYKETVQVEVALKNEALKQKATIQQLMHFKSEELDRSTLECMKLQERNMALAKELAALKLVSDLNLDEDEALKLACLGNEVNSKETIDVLKKSLVIRNKSYKELMTKCNVLGRGEARSLSKLEKAKDKIKKLKERIQELESVAEVKVNETLRTLKASRKSACEVEKLAKGFDQGSRNDVTSCRDQNKEPVPETEMGTSENSSCSLKKRKLNSSGFTSNRSTTDNVVPRKINPANQDQGYFLHNQVENARETFVHLNSCGQLKPLAENGGAAWKSGSRTGDTLSEIQAERHGSMDGASGAVGDTKPNTENRADMVDNNMVILDDDMGLPQSLLNVRKETPLPAVVSQPGSHCFSGGLLGPDGTKWHLGKWCKRNKGQASLSMGLQGSNASTADLIAVGADGRGGRIKVLRSLNQSSLDNRENLTSTKKCKVGDKPSSFQSHGCLQIEHFFGRASQ